MVTKRYVGLREIVQFTLWLVTICVLLALTDLLWRWDQLIYDAQQRLITRPAPEDVIIVAIDEASLADLGRWPWRRKNHADLINRISAENAQVIALDIIFAEPDWQHPKDDIELVQAVAKSGRVILPVLVEQAHQGGILRETLPLPELVENSAALGHVHFELESDGIARSVFLYEGLGSPHWPALGVAVMQFVQAEERNNLPGQQRHVSQTSPSQFMWVRDYYVKIPFYGSPGHFNSISYSQVLKGQYPKNLFQDKIVFVGVTATGLGDSLPTPVSGLSQAMPGVEINATTFSALRSGIMIEDLPQEWRLIISAALVMLPLLFFLRLRPRIAWFSTLFLIVFVLIINTLLIHLFHLWFAPFAVLLTLVLSYPLWSWRRLEFTMRYMDEELSLLNEQRGIPAVDIELDADVALEYLRRWMPLAGFEIHHSQHQRMFAWGDLPDNHDKNCGVGVWTKAGKHVYWTNLEGVYGGYKIGIRWESSKGPDARQNSVLIRLAMKLIPDTVKLPQDTLEVIQSRAQLVHNATQELSNLKRFIETTLDQMADAVLVVNSFGQVILSNKRATRMFAVNDHNGLTGHWVLPLMNTIHLGGNKDWDEIFSQFYARSKPMQIQARIGKEMDILVNVSPMYIGEEYKYDAVVVNISNITNLVESERRRQEALTFLSHDLRAPLSSILGVTQLMSTPKQKDNFQKNLSRISSYAQRTIQLAEEFVQIARIEGKEELILSEIDIIDIASNALDQVWEQANAKEIILGRQFQQTECIYLGNAGLLERAFVNLLTNSIKYSNNSRRVDFIIKSTGEVITCLIRDQGFGIPAEEISNIFKKYHRLESGSHSEIKGFGLGLAFVKVVVERHGGSIEIESEPGTGTSVKLQFPVKLKTSKH